MLGEHHDLNHEFPQYKQRIHELKERDAHFAKLCHEYEEADKEVYRIEEQIETPSDDYTEEVKKRRLLLKDQIFAMLSQSK
ncbi:MAG TPA: DUF465 domain-containing protein [Candidatus Tenderia sp.]|nr:DUF465 domain-containing protein [Candidatus Tenderia sp.]